MADTETKVVKAQTKKTANTAGEGPKVQIRAVDKAIIEAQQAKKTRSAAPRTQSAAKPAIVVTDDPTTDFRVSLMASAIASFGSGCFCSFSLKLCHKKIE